MPLPHVLDRSVLIGAPRETVFLFFTDDQRWAGWWGPGSTIDARPGGKVLVRYPNGVEASGEVVAVAAPERIVFTFGYASGQPMPPGASEVTIRLEAVSGGTRLTLTHAFGEAAVRDHHVQGWRYQLAVFANVVANHVQAHAAELVDRWCEAWAETDAAKRQADLAAIAHDDVRFADKFGLVHGIADLLPQIAAAQQFMPGVRMARDGEIRHCQGTVLADFRMIGPDGAQMARGANVFTFGPDGRIASVVGFW